MFKILLSLLCFLSSSLAFAFDPTVIAAPVEKVYVPKGFDNNDSVQVVVAGNFPNPCYAVHTTEVKVVEDKILVSVTAIAPNQLNAQICADVLSPFKEEVNIGLLKKGEYQIIVNQTSENPIKGGISIASSQSSLLDDYLYLDVLYIEQNEGNKTSFKIKGMRYSPCFEIDRIETISNGKDTISVLPILKQVSDFCPMKGQPLSVDTDIDLSGLESDKVLLHVRKSDGKSFNSIVTKE
jgi:hypothetical protein